MRMRSFVKIKSWQNGEINLSFIDIGKSYPSHKYVNAFRENKILAKKSEFTVFYWS